MPSETKRVALLVALCMQCQTVLISRKLVVVIGGIFLRKYLRRSFTEEHPIQRHTDDDVPEASSRRYVGIEVKQRASNERRQFLQAARQNWRHGCIFYF